MKCSGSLGSRRTITFLFRFTAITTLAFRASFIEKQFFDGVDGASDHNQRHDNILNHDVSLSVSW